MKLAASREIWSFCGRVEDAYVFHGGTGEVSLAGEGMRSQRMLDAFLNSVPRGALVEISSVAIKHGDRVLDDVELLILPKFQISFPVSGFFKTSPFSDAALAVWNAGHNVLPVEQKKPAVCWRQWEVIHQTRQEVDDLVAQFSDYDIALVLGRGGIVDFETEGDHGEELWCEWKKKYGPMPEFYMFGSLRGVDGFHRVGLVSSDVNIQRIEWRRTRTGQIVIGGGYRDGELIAEFRGCRCYSVIPPSRGRSYMAGSLDALPEFPKRLQAYWRLLVHQVKQAHQKVSQ